MIYEYCNQFTFNSLKVCVYSSSFQLFERLNKDFSYFQSDFNDTPFLTIEVNQVEADLSVLKNLSVWRKTSSSITYDDRNTRYNDYRSKGMTIFNYEINKGEIFSTDLEFLHELSYLMILSIVGKELDLLGIHRIHAMGVTVGDLDCLCMLPMGGGKSTLLANLLKYNDIEIISDDSPLITSDGKIKIFPIRLGVDPKLIDNIINPDENVYSLTRREYGSKALISLRGISSKVSSTNGSKQILIQGKRISGSDSRLRKARLYEIISSMLINLIIGIGLPMIFEYFWRSGIKDFFRKTKIFFKRLFCSLQLVRRSEFYVFEMGDRPSDNADMLYSFLKSKLE